MRYLILFPIAGICLYEMLLVRRNKISKQREFKLGNRIFESLVVGPIVSKKIKQRNQSMIYKQETKEVALVKSVIEKLVEANQFQSMIAPNYKVSVVHSDILAMFYSPDHHLFISSQILQAAEMDEASLGLLVAHELSHFLLDHQTQRMTTMMGTILTPFISQLLDSTRDNFSGGLN